MPNIKVGDKVRFTADAVPDVEYTGVVERISDATGSAFSLIPIMFTEDEHGVVFTIGQCRGNYMGFRGTRKFKIRYHTPGRVLEAEIDYTGDRIMSYNMVLR